MKKIVFFLPALGSGGAERVTVLISEQLIAEGYDVEILLLKNVVHYNVKSNVPITSVFEKDQSMGKFKRMRTIVSFLRNYIKKNDAVLVPMLNSCLRYSVLMKLLTRVKVIACERNDPYSQYKSKTQRWIRRKLFDLSDYAIFQTEDAKNFYSQKTKNKSVVIPNPVSLPEIKWEKNHNHTLVTVCRLNPQKNLKMAVDAIGILKESVPDIHLNIYGEGAEASALSEYIKEKGLESQISLCGTTKNTYEVLRQSNVFILTSDFEGISNSMLEALAVGMPVIVTDCPIGGAKMMIRNDETGILIPVGDTAMLVQAVKRVLADEAFAEKIGAQSAESMKAYTLDKIANQWLDAVNKV